jgi:DNA-binding CsgD family transcriptional regulator
VREDVPLAVPELSQGQARSPKSARTSRLASCLPGLGQTGQIVEEPGWDAYYAVVFAASVAIVEGGPITATGRIIAAGRLVTHVRRPPRESLSARETEVLARVARGRTNAEIGRELFISEATVKTHLLRAFGKLGVSDRTAAVTTAIQRGLLPPLGR